MEPMVQVQLQELQEAKGARACARSCTSGAEAQAARFGARFSESLVAWHS